MRYSIVFALLIAACGNGNGDKCGNLAIEPDETCDGSNLANHDCVSIDQGFTGGTLACLSDCSGWDTSGCTSAEPDCGNQEKEAGEVCDGTDLDDNDCTTIGQDFTGGDLACLSDCSAFDSDACTTDVPDCGNDAKESGEVCDGTDLDDNDCTTLGQSFTGGELGCLGDCSGFDTGACVTEGTDCGDNLAEPGEVCDGTDLRDNNCETIGMGFSGGDLGCLGDCSGWDTADCTGGQFDSFAELPREEPDVTLHDTTGWTTLTVGAGGGYDYDNIQAAYDQAVILGASEPVEILVQVGYMAGLLRMGNRQGSTHWIYIQPESQDGIPDPGVRATRLDAPGMYQLRGTLGGTTWEEPVWTHDGAGYTRFIGADISVPDDSTVRARSNVVRLAADLTQAEPSTNEADQPTHITLDRCYVHLPDDGTRHPSNAVRLDGKHLALIDSYVFIGGRDRESHAVMSGWGLGPLLIENCYLAAASINVFFGGVDTIVPGWRATDVTIRRNHLHKPMSWMTDNADNVLVKNLFEIKNAKRVLIEDCVMENNWAHSQTGKAILLRAENQYGLDQPEGRSSTCQDITIRWSKVINTPCVFDILAVDQGPVDEPARRISIHDLLAYRIGNNADGTGSKSVMRMASQAGNELVQLDMNHVTYADQGDTDGSSFISLQADAGSEILLHNMIGFRGQYGIKRDGTVEGTESLDLSFPSGGYLFDYNVLVGANAASYPPEQNAYPASQTEVMFEDATNFNYRLQQSSPFAAGSAQAGSDGKDRGCDVEMLETRLTGVTGVVNP